MNRDAPAARGPKLKLEDILLRHGAITQEQVAQAQDEQRKWGGELGRILVDLGFINEGLLMKAYGHQLNIPVSSPDTDALSADIVKALGVQLCERYGVIAVDGDLKKKTLRVATSDPTNSQELRAVETTCGYRIEPAAATSDSIQRAIRKFFYGEALSAAAEAPMEIEGREAAPPSAPKGLPAKKAPPSAAPAPAQQAADNGMVALAAAQITSLTTRLAEVEDIVRPLQEHVNHAVEVNPHFAALVARLDMLEQVITNAVTQTRQLTELLVEKGVFSKEEARARGPKRSP